MTNPLSTIIVDTDALIALFNKDDLHATAAMTLLEQLTTDNVRLLYPATTIAETVTTLQRRFANAAAAAEVANLLRSGSLLIAPITLEVLAEALTFFHPH